MNLQFCSIASGSSGNSYIIRSESTTLLVDVGISGKRITTGLEAVNISPSHVSGILITHEHSDHVKSIKVMQKNCPQARVYLNRGTWHQIKADIKEGNEHIFTTGQPFAIGDIWVKPFPISHDAAEPVGYTFEKNNSRIAVMTDTGHVTDSIYNEIKGSDLFVLEANHDENILKMCGYPYHIKRRILSNQGHLSNDSAAACLCRIIGDTPRENIPHNMPKILLAHLSRENNTPDMALITIQNILEEAQAGMDCKISMEDLDMSVLARDQQSPVFTL